MALPMIRLRELSRLEMRSARNWAAPPTGYVSSCTACFRNYFNCANRPMNHGCGGWLNRFCDLPPMTQFDVVSRR